MHIIKRLFRALSTGIFRFCLLSLPLLIAVAVVFGSPTYTNRTLKDSGLYDNLMPGILDQSIPNNKDPQAKQLLSDTGVRNAVIGAFPGSLLQQDAESFINGMYGWLEGKTNEPQFSIDLTTPKQNLAKNLSAYAVTRAGTLPPCTASQIKQLTGNQTLLSLPCLPPGLNVNQAAEQFTNDVLSGANLADAKSLTAADLPKDPKTGQSVFSRQTVVSQAYKWLKQSPLIFGGIAVLMGACVVLLSDKRRAGLKTLAWTAVGAGIFWLLGALIYWFIFHGLHQSLDKIMNTALRSSVEKIISGLAGSVNTIIAIVAGTYLTMGIAALIVLRATNSKPALEDADATTPPSEIELPPPPEAPQKPEITSQSETNEHKGE